MNGIFEANQVLIELFTQAGANTIVLGAVSDIDLSKQNIYPYVHFTIDSCSLDNGSLAITYTILIADIVDKNSNESFDDLNRTDNLEDVFHNLLKVVSSVLSALDNTSIIHSVASPVNLTAFMKGENNTAGWIATVTLTGNNNIIKANCP